MRRTANLFFRGWTSWCIPLVLLLATILVFDLTNLDIAIQDHFYTPGEGWLISMHKYSGFGLVYYTIPKFLLGNFSAVVLALGVWRFIHFKKVPHGIIYVLVTMLTIPCVVANLKSNSSMPYPSKITRYGGKEEPRTVIEAFRNPLQPSGKHYHGWPAGHASGGFSLMGLAFVPAPPRRRWLGFAITSAIGFSMGICHTMDGNHFFSHNLASFFIAWFIAALLYQLYTAALAWREKRHPRPAE